MLQQRVGPRGPRSKEQGDTMKQPAALSFGDWYVATYLRHRCQIVRSGCVEFQGSGKSFTVGWLADQDGDMWRWDSFSEMLGLFGSLGMLVLHWIAAQAATLEEAIVLLLKWGTRALAKRCLAWTASSIHNARRWCIWHACCIFDYSDSSRHSIWKAFGRVQIPWVSWAYCRIVCVESGLEVYSQGFSQSWKAKGLLHSTSWFRVENGIIWNYIGRLKSLPCLLSGVLSCFEKSQVGSGLDACPGNQRWVAKFSSFLFSSKWSTIRLTIVLDCPL